MTPPAPAHGGRRTDIQVLRGYAVVAVILFHAGLGLAPSGYLGVDMFFVISGYLVGGIVMRARAAGTFRLDAFYARRARRLLPAAYAVLAATTLAAILLLTPAAYARYWQQLVGTLGFATNIVLWRQINYFNDSATVEPLLHLWSLAVEEQFYLLLPATLAIVPRRWWTPAIAVGTLASALLYAWLYPRSPGIGFYALPPRAWEIGLGALAACFPGGGIAGRVARALLLPAIALLAVAPLIVPPAHLAHLLALPVCGATAIVLLGNRGAARGLGALARIGDASYSLYLVHWPLFAFANTIYVAGPLPHVVALLLIAATGALGFLSWHLIEEPARRTRAAPRRLWRLVIAGAGALLVLGAVGMRVMQTRPAGIDLAGVTGLDLPGCDADATAFDGRCTPSTAPEILVWGDSYSQHLIPALLASTPRPIVQASKGACASLLGIAPLDIQASARTARGCIAYNASVLAYLARTPSVRVVVLSARYLRFAIPGTRALVDDTRGPRVVESIDLAALAHAQARTARAIRATGKRVILVTAPPQAGFDVGQCWDRTLRRLPRVTAAPRCAIVPANQHPLYPFTRALMDAFAASTPLVRLDRALCGGQACATALDAVPLYRDTGHLGRAGSAALGRRLRLGERVWRDAR